MADDSDNKFKKTGWRKWAQYGRDLAGGAVGLAVVLPSFISFASQYIVYNLHNDAKKHLRNSENTSKEREKGCAFDFLICDTIEQKVRKATNIYVKITDHIQLGLDIAIESNDVAGTEKFLKMGVDPNFAGEIPLFLGFTDTVEPVLCATLVRGTKPDLKIISLLLDHGADPNGKDRYDRSPLDTAICNNYIGVAEILLERGAIPSPSSRQSATSEGKTEIVALLDRWETENQRRKEEAIRKEQEANKIKKIAAILPPPSKRRGGSLE